MPVSPTPGFSPGNLFKKDGKATVAQRDLTILDSDWIKSRFMVPDADMPADIVKYRYDTAASLKYADTTLGGSLFINPRPQYNAMTDPKISNIARGTKGGMYNTPGFNHNVSNTGMGAGYSETIDDNQEIVYMEFGVPKFNSLIDFFFRAVDYADSVLANTGRPALAYDAGVAAGSVLRAIAFPLVSAMAWAGSKLKNIIFGQSHLQFYYFNPKMYMYWTSVNTIVTQLVTEQGLLSPMFMPDKSSGPGTMNIGMPVGLAQSDIDYFNKLVPDAIGKHTNYVDVYHIAANAQRKGNAQKEYAYKLRDSKSNTPLNSTDKILIEHYHPDGFFSKASKALSFSTYMKGVNVTEGSLGPGDATPTKGTKPTLPKHNNHDGKFVTNPDKSFVSSVTDKAMNWVTAAAGTYSSALANGGGYAIFAVNYTGATSESFSNSTANIDLGDKAKALAGKSRSLSFDLARGNLIGDNVINDAIGYAKDAIMGVASGATFGLTNVLQTITGNAYVEMPKRWEDSSMNFQQHNYTMELRSPYNTFLSQLQNIYMPLCMILAGVLPLSTGKSSYTSPYLCTLFNKGIESIRMGMITSVTIKRGTTNLGFDKKRRALGIDVSFTVTDFSTLVTSPVNSSIFGDGSYNNMEDDTPLGNYISVLGARDVLHNKYSTYNAAKRATKLAMSREMLGSSDRMGFYLGDKLSNTLAGALSTMSMSAVVRN